MKNKTTPTVRRALKMALKDVAGWVVSVLLYMTAASAALGMVWWGDMLLSAYYPTYTRVISILTCMMVPGLVVASELLLRARKILGDNLPHRQHRGMDAAILLIQAVQVATAFALSWMIYHTDLMTPDFMLPVMAVCAVVVAWAACIRFRTGLAGR